jgi:hypothetical protein
MREPINKPNGEINRQLNAIDLIVFLNNNFH